MKSIRINILLTILGSILCSATMSFTGTSAAEIIEDMPQIHEHCQQALQTLAQHLNTAWQQIRPCILYLMLRAQEHRLPFAHHILNLINAEQQDRDTRSVS